MNKLMAVLLVLGCSLALAQTQDSAQPKLSPAPPAQDAGSQKARALLDKMIAALGGNAYLTYTARTEQGRSYSFYGGQAKGLGTGYWLLWQYPDKDRIELGKKRDVIQVHNGDQGYEITFRGTAALGEKEMQEYLRRRSHSLETVLRDWLKDPKTLVLYSGSAMVDNHLAEQITLVNGNDDAVVLSIDANNYLPVRKSFSYRDPLDNLKTEESDTYGNYRLEQGLMTARTIVHTRNGEIASQRFISKVEYNPQLSASLFEAKVTYDPQNLKGKR